MEMTRAQEREQMNMSRDEMAQLKKIGIYAGLGLVGLFLIQRLVKKIKEKSAANEAQRVLDNITNVDRNELTIKSDEQAQNYAEGLYDSMKDVGTDTDRIRQIIANLKTASDWNLVIRKFGNKPYANAGAPWFDWYGSPKSLYGWFQAELSGNLLDEIEKIWNKYSLPQ